MLRAIIFGARVRKLQRNLRSLDKKHRRIIENAKKESDYFAVHDRLNFEWFNDSEELSEMIEELQSDYLINWAQRARVPTPMRSAEENESWVGSNRTGKMRLTKTAALDLRKALRLEGKENFESWSRWLTPISQLVAGAVSILSLIAAIIALRLKNSN